MMKCLGLLLLFCLSELSQACPVANPTLGETLKANELQYLLARVPPAFGFAIEDKALHLTVESHNDCLATLLVQIPEADIREGLALLDDQPAKKIMLMSQGYSLPESTQNKASYHFDAATLRPMHQDTLQTAELGKLRASIEMLYALLSQSRASMTSESQSNTGPWDSRFKTSQIDTCIASAKSIENQEHFCTCKINQIEQGMGQRQFAYIQYVRSNPYAQATGSANSFASLEAKAIKACQ